MKATNLSHYKKQFSSSLCCAPYIIYVSPVPPKAVLREGTKMSVIASILHKPDCRILTTAAPMANSFPRKPEVPLPQPRPARSALEWARRLASEPCEVALPLSPALLARLLRDVWIREGSFFENSTFADSTALSDVRIPKPVILCIGTDRIIGDSLGPLTGSLLERHAGNEPALSVYGTLDATVHACNLAETLIQIKKKHPDSVVIAVDASLGNENKIGSVLVHPGSLKPGMGVKKDLPAVGDISITGIAGLQNSQPYLALQTARLSLIMMMAEQICACILEACRSLPVYEENLSVISK